MDNLFSKLSESEWKNLRDEDKLEAMERKLKVIEKFIIHDVANKIALNESKKHACRCVSCG